MKLAKLTAAKIAKAANDSYKEEFAPIADAFSFAARRDCVSLDFFTKQVLRAFYARTLIEDGRIQAVEEQSPDLAIVGSMVELAIQATYRDLFDYIKRFIKCGEFSVLENRDLYLPTGRFFAALEEIVKD